MRHRHGRNNRESQDSHGLDHHDAEAQGRRLASNDNGSNGRARNRSTNSTNDDFKENGEEKVDLDKPEPESTHLPESTHTLLFTQPICSTPFGFSIAIIFLSFSCLTMALSYNLPNALPGNPLGVPANVAREVRIASYLAIFIALLMEEGEYFNSLVCRIIDFHHLRMNQKKIWCAEQIVLLTCMESHNNVTLHNCSTETEIPTALHQLRTIPAHSFKTRFPNKSYNMFVFSAVIRILLGYIFLGKPHSIFRSWLFEHNVIPFRSLTLCFGINN